MASEEYEKNLEPKVWSLPSSIGVERFHVKTFKEIPSVSISYVEHGNSDSGIVAEITRLASINIVKQINDEIIRYYVSIAKKAGIDELILMDEEKCKQFIMWAITEYKLKKETADEQMKMYASLFGLETNKKETATEKYNINRMEGEQWPE